MSRILIVGLMSIAAMHSGTAEAEPSAGEQAAIDHLLAFIESSACMFERNGRRYGSERALSHVSRKYRHFEDEIETAEDFIELAASRSTVSGEPYYFVCDGEAVESARVLGEELARFRADADADTD